MHRLPANGSTPWVVLLKNSVEDSTSIQNLEHLDKVSYLYGFLLQWHSEAQMGNSPLIVFATVI